jgi:GT2 family glycosyltransferase
MAPAPDAPAVATIVLNWNRWRRTLDCVRSLEAQDYPNSTTIVVDNGSRDGSLARLEADGGDFTLLPTGRNLGYAGGNNAGIRRALAAGAEYVWVLNNDTRVHADALTELVRAARANPAAGVVVSRQVEPGSGEQQPSAYRLRGDLGTALELRSDAAERGSAETRDGRVRTELIRCAGCAAGVHVADIVEGPSMLIRRAAIDDAGVFDERYFHYFEDTDLMLRIRRAGWREALACRSTVEHGTGESLFVQTPQAQYYMRRNELLFRRKLLGERPLAVLAREPRKLRSAIAVRSALALDARPTTAALLALADGVRGRTGPRDLGPGYRVDPRERSRSAGAASALLPPAPQER